MDNFALTTDERQLRIDLAAAFRAVAKLGIHEAVANHFSAAVSADGSKFLMNPKWRHFSRIRASDRPAAMSPSVARGLAPCAMCGARSPSPCSAGRLVAATSRTA